VPNSLAQAREQKPLSLWQLFKKMCSQDTRRALSATLGLVESFGKKPGLGRNAKPHPGESDLTGIDTAAEPPGGTDEIGFIGLGIMGSRMAANLQKHGHSLVVFNRTREKAEPLVAQGATWADSPAALAPKVEVIFTMLAHPDAVEQAALGNDGFLQHPEPGKCGLIAAPLTRRSQEKWQQRPRPGCWFPRRPGDRFQRPGGDGETHLLGGGETSDLEKCRPLFECMGNRIIHCGGPGTGASLKMVMNQLLGTIMAAFAEGLVWVSL